MFEDILILKKGGIHIKKKNRGKFTEYCGGKVTQECIAKGKKSKDPKIRKRATFASNSRRWKHENGGILKYQNPSYPLLEGLNLTVKNNEFSPQNTLREPMQNADVVYTIGNWLNNRREQLYKNMQQMYSGGISTETFFGTPFFPEPLFNENNPNKEVNREINRQLNRAEQAGYKEKLLPLFTSGLYDTKGNNVLLSTVLDDGSYEKDVIKLHEFLHASGYNSPQEYVIAQYFKGRKGDNYTLDPSEIYAKLGTFREMFNIDPNHKYTLSEIKALRKQLKAEYGDVFYTSLSKPFNDKIHKLKVEHVLKNIPKELKTRWWWQGEQNFKENLYRDGTYLRDVIEEFNIQLPPEIEDIELEKQKAIEKHKKGRSDSEMEIKGFDGVFWMDEFSDEDMLFLLNDVAQNTTDPNRIDYKDLATFAKDGGILKAQEGTGNLYTPHPLSPVGIALNQAKAMTKMKGEQQHLPPGVKEVIGPDGKKIAIRTEQPLVPLEQSIAEWLPGTGDVAEVGYIADDVKNGNYGSAALTAAMVALPGNVGKVLRKSDIPASKSTKVVVEESKPRWANTSQSKLSESERLGIPKGERNQPGKPRSPRAVEYDVADGRPTKEFLDDYHAYAEALKTGGRHVDITDMFDSSWYRQRLLNQGLTEEQADQLILRLKDRVSPENLVIVDGLNSVRNFRRIEDGIPVEMTPERLTLFGRHTTGPGLFGKSLIELSTKADPEEIILHEIGGHRSQPLVADFKNIYLDQALTNLGLQRHMKIGKTADYGLNWGEVRARALTIAKQMSDAGWNPNSPEQVNVWLNKHIFTNSPKNANQGALYYDRPRFIKAVSEGLKNGGKL